MENHEPIAIKLSSEHLIVALRWLDIMSSETKWNLTHTEKLNLLGNISGAQLIALHSYDQSCQLSEFAQSVLQRLVLLIGIARDLAALVGSENSYMLFSKKNSHAMFESQSIKGFLLNSESIESYEQVLTYLENAMNGCFF